MRVQKKSLENIFKPRLLSTFAIHFKAMDVQSSQAIIALEHEPSHLFLGSFPSLICLFPQMTYLLAVILNVPKLYYPHL